MDDFFGPQITPPSLSDNEGDNDDDSYESFARKRDLTEYIRTVISLESIFKSYKGQPNFVTAPRQTPKPKSAPWFVSMRVVTPVIHPISKDTIAVTTSNCTLNHATSKWQSPEGGGTVQLDTLSLLANLPSHMTTVSGTQIHSTIKQTLERGISGNAIRKDVVPRILIVCTNVLDELYEMEATFEDLLKHKSDMGMNNLSWETYLRQIHYAIHIYGQLTDFDDGSKAVTISYEDESKDLMKLTLVSPLASSGTDNMGSLVRLKYEFELCAIRSHAQYSERMVSFVFDQTHYSSELYNRRLKDQKILQDLNRELQDVKQKLMLSEDRLALFSSQPGRAISTDTPFDVTVGQQGEKENSSQSRNAANRAKRKAPQNLLNPAMKKRKVQVGGLKIK